MSGAVFAIFAKVTPLVQSVSLDEAFLDVTGCQRLHGDPVSIARRIRASIRRETLLTASVGVASCRFVAKIASDLDKPDGLTVIPEEEMFARLDPLPVSKIWGVGPVTNRRLANLGITTIGQLRQWPLSSLVGELGQLGEDLHRLANGLDDSQVVSDEEDKSISHETTFSHDLSDMEELEAVLLALSDKVAGRLRRHGLSGRTVFLKLRYSDFTTVTRRVSFDQPTDLLDVIYGSARELLRERTQAGARPVRLLGVGVSGFHGGGKGKQARLFSDSRQDLEKLRRLEHATDIIRKKMGRDAIARAAAKFIDPEL